MEKHWTEKLFIDAAHLWGADLEGRVERAKEEALALIKIFSEFHVLSGALVLDLACGIGRHSVALAENGCRVVGVDISPAFIKRAKEMADERGVSANCNFRVGDMRQISEVLSSYKEKFNVVLNLYTSMGYYDEETDKLVLMQLLELAAPEGVLVIDGAPRDRFIRHWRSTYVGQFGDDLILIQKSKLNLENSRINNIWKFYRKQENGDLKHLDTIETSHRIYSLHEVKRQVKESGWTYQTCYGGFDRGPYTTDSRRMVLIAQKF